MKALSTLIVHALPVLALGAVLGGASVARADQFVVTDEEYTHTAVMMSHHTAPPTEVLPSNWASPVDYRKGTMHVRVELKTVASNRGIRWLVVFSQPGVYVCGTQKAMTGPGVYEWDAAVSKYSCKNAGYDYGAPPKSLSYVIRDASGVKVDSGQAYAGAPDLAQYYPFQARVTVTMVSNGATYEPPAPEMDAAVADGGNTDGSAPDAAANDAMVSDSDGGGGGTFADGEVAGDAATHPMLDSGTEPEGPSRGGAGATGVQGKGCAFVPAGTKASPRHAWLWAGALLAMAARRRARPQRKIWDRN